MIRFFDSHFPSRVLYLILLTSTLVVGFILFDFSYSENILRWMIAGEKVLAGNIIYKEVWISEGPLFAWVSSLVFGVFERSRIAFLLFGFGLVTIQALYFTSLLNRSKILKNKSYVPALIYVLFFFIHYQLVGLSPELLGMTFLLIAFRTIMVQHMAESFKGVNLNVGLLLGLAILCSPLYLYFIPLIFIAMVSFSTVTGRNILLLLIGIVLPLVLVGTYMFMVGGILHFTRFFVSKMIFAQNSEEPDLIKILSLLVIPAFFILLGIVKSYADSSSNFVEKVKRIFLLWFVVALVVFGLNFRSIDINMMVLLSVPFSYYISLFLVGWRKKIMAEITFVVLISAMIGVGLYVGDSVYMQKQVTDDRFKEFPSGDQFVFDFGGRIDQYREREFGTAFINNDLMREYLKTGTNADLIETYLAVTVDLPVYVVDNEEEVFAAILNRIPILGGRYTNLGNGRYQLKNKK